MRRDVEHQPRNSASAESARPSCVVITRVAPIPSMGGSHIRIASSISSLAPTFDVRVYSSDSREELAERARTFCSELGVPISTFELAGWFRRKVSYLLGALSSLTESIPVMRLPPELRAEIRHSDLVWVYRQTPFMFCSVPRRRVGQLIIDIDDLEERVVSKHDHASRLGRIVAARKLKRCRSRVLRAADVAVVCSDLDSRRIERKCPVAVLPNTYPLGERLADTRTPQSFKVVVVGLMDYPPNRQGVQWFLETVWDRIRSLSPHAHLAIAGRGSHQAFVHDPGRNVRVIGAFEHASTILSDAGVVVVPIHVGSGTRVKILEAFAFGVPVVSTSVGAEGLDVTDGESILIADDPQSFAEAVVRVLEDAELSTRLATQGRIIYDSLYAPAVFAETVLEIADRAVQDHA